MTERMSLTVAQGNPTRPSAETAETRLWFDGATRRLREFCGGATLPT